MAANKQYKDSVFTSLFGEKAPLLELYNAISGTHYQDPSAIEINTLPDVLFMNRRNDISFTIDRKAVILYEHQSSLNGNMPLRLLLYIARVYERLIEPKAVYRRKQVTIPRPEFIVLYNGKEGCPAEQTLSLSDAFAKTGDDRVFLDLKVRVLNINKGCNRELERRSKTLEGYAEFVACVREYEGEKYPLEAAVKKAVSHCIERGILKEYLEKNAGEVLNMLLTEFNMEDALAVRYEEGWEGGLEKGWEGGREEGLEKGREEGLEKGWEGGLETAAKNALAEGASLDFIRKITGLDIETIRNLAGPGAG